MMEQADQTSSFTTNISIDNFLEDKKIRSWRFLKKNIYRMDHIDLFFWTPYCLRVLDSGKI